jgi:hypothetical protein
MSHTVYLEPTNTCQHEYIAHYWHKNKDCLLTDCAVDECLECEMFVTECEMPNLEKEETK